MKARILDALARGGAILACWLLFLVAEHLAVGIGYRHLFVASWEMAIARNHLSLPLLAVLAPLAVLIAFAARSIEQVAPRSRRLIALVTTAIFGALVAWGTSHGRHFEAPTIRIAFVIVVTALAATFGAFVVPRLLARAFSHPRVAIGASLVLAIIFWLVDARVLPRLYPAFHDACFTMILGGGALAALCAVRLVPALLRTRALMLFPVIASFGLYLAPRAARALSFASNVRFVLADRAPFLGRAIALIDHFSQSEEGAEHEVAGSLPTSSPRELHWDDESLLLVTVDALRADHVGAYGYGRPTTPAIDALAKEGTLFEAAYCPTPHTSYSVTSLMTGKYMRPLMNHGLGEDSELFATSLRRYGFKTGAFYPPAVFFIDGARFSTFSEKRLGFEYARVEFADPKKRVEQIDRYLQRTKDAARVFVWVHLFEPHEPYEAHEEFRYGERQIDRYDGEIRFADEGIGDVVKTFRAARPNAAIIVTADHGEEFDEHGGNYHGTTVFEEQVRVPLVVVGKGVVPGARKKTVVQTIDLFPTVTSALGIPRDPRILGRDLGGLLHGATDDAGLAYVEVDRAELLAKGADRLVCARTQGESCALYDVSRDPLERVDESRSRREKRTELFQIRRKLFSDLTRYEPKTRLPASLKAAEAGDLDAAKEVLSLLDDASPEVRRAAARVLFDLAKPSLPTGAEPPLEMKGAFTRSLAHDDDAATRAFVELALLRANDRLLEGDRARISELLLKDDTKLPAAIVLGEHGDLRAQDLLISHFQKDARLSENHRRAILRILEKAHTKAATDALVRAFVEAEGYPQVRREMLDALVANGDKAAVGPMLEAFAKERYVDLREREASALFTLGAGTRMLAPLRRFAGMPDSRKGMLVVAESLNATTPIGGFISDEKGTTSFALTALNGSREGSMTKRLLVEQVREAPLALTIDGVAHHEPASIFFSVIVGKGPEVHVTSEISIRRAWLVDAEDELPPPAKEPWDGGSAVDED